MNVIDRQKANEEVLKETAYIIIRDISHLVKIVDECKFKRKDWFIKFKKELDSMGLGV